MRVSISFGTALLLASAAASAQPCAGPFWSSLGTGIQSDLEFGLGLSLAHAVEEGRPWLYLSGVMGSVGGIPTSTSCGRWNGQHWEDPRAPFFGSATRFHVAQSRAGPRLFEVAFDPYGGPSILYEWTSGEWRRLGAFSNGGFTGGSLACVYIYEDAAGESLFAGGGFQFVDNVPARALARWDGTNWSEVGGGIASFSPGNGVHDMIRWDDGTGPALYVVGGFGSAGGLPAKNIAKWDGSRLVPTSFGTNNFIWDAEVFDDGGRPALYIGGTMTSTDGVPVSAVAKWDGKAWANLGGGMAVTLGYSSVRRLVPFDDGTGPALFAGGVFDRAGGVSSTALAKWDGQQWHAMGGLTVAQAYPYVEDMLVFDDGRGPGLFVTGQFAYADGLRVNHIARWGCFAPPPPPCRANCTGDTDPVTGKPELDILDFICFQNAFALGDKSKADVGGVTSPCGTPDGKLDFFDFVCFQNLFALGCP